MESRSEPLATGDGIEVRAPGAAMRRRPLAILVPTLVAFFAIAVYVNVATPLYTSAAQVLANDDDVSARPGRIDRSPEQVSPVDAETVASQTSLIRSRDLARRAVAKLGLRSNPEFDPQVRSGSPFAQVLVLLGITSTSSHQNAEARTVTAFLDRLAVILPAQTRVVTIAFTSRDPALAARGANTVAELYLQARSAARRAQAGSTADALAAQIADLRIKLAGADADAERYRLQTGLLAGSSDTVTIKGQQLTDINTDLSKARSAQADAQAKATMIRDLLRVGKSADVPDVINNDIVRRISDQRVAAQAQLALESRTLLAGHPRIKELTAQLAQYDSSLKTAARQAAVTLENEAKIAGQRVANLEAIMAQQKQSVGVADADETHLRALERTGQSYKDQLESATTKYREALALQSSMAPAESRIISRAVPPQTPSFPKKLPLILLGTVATFLVALGCVLAGDLFSARPRRVAPSALHEGSSSRSAKESAREVEAVPAIEPGPQPAVPATGLDGASKTAPVRTRKGRFDIASMFSRASIDEQADPLDPPPDPLPSKTGRDPKAADPASAPVKAAASGGMLQAARSYLRTFGQSAAASSKAVSVPPAVAAEDADGVGWTVDAPVTPKGEILGDLPREASRTLVPAAAAARDASCGDIGWLTARIVSAHVPGRGLHIVGTSLGSGDATAILVDLSRDLAEKGRSVIVDLNRTPLMLAPLAGAGSEGRDTIAAMHGLAELLAGDASFAEVIHRDHASRLHFIPTGLQEADFRDFDLILDALSETYDFVVLLTPSFPQSEIAKVMAPYAEFVVLTAATDPDDATLATLENELIEAGAREVLVAGVAPRDRRDVA